MDTKELKIRELSDVFRPNPDKGIYPAPLNAWFVSKPLLGTVETIIYNRNTTYPAPLNAWFVSKPLLGAVETIIYNRNTIYPAPLNAWFVSKPLLGTVETIIYNRNTVYPGGSRVKKLVTEALVSAVNDVNYGY